MTHEKSPALLVVVIRAALKQWYVAGIGPEGTVTPLVRSERGNLDQYVGQRDDEQLSFLRHRLSGAMQRGCDRLWAKEAKAARIVLIADDNLPDSDSELLQRLADHFHTWMTRPPVTCYRGHGGSTIEDLESLECLVGQPDAPHATCLQSALPDLVRQIDDDDSWEIVLEPKNE